MMMALGIRLREGQRANGSIAIDQHDAVGGHRPHGVEGVPIDNRVPFLREKQLTSTGDDGLKAFIPPLAWKFIAQF